MPDRRRRVHVNALEEASDVALRAAAQRNGLRVLLKMRLADAIQLWGSGVDDVDYDYGLRSH